MRPDRAGVLPPPHEEHRWPRAACQTLAAGAVRLGVCRCRCGCDPAHPCRPIVDRSNSGQFCSRSLREKTFSLSSNPHRILIALSCVLLFQRQLFESSDLSLQLVFKVRTYADIPNKLRTSLLATALAIECGKQLRSVQVMRDYLSCQGHAHGEQAAIKGHPYLAPIFLAALRRLQCM